MEPNAAFISPFLWKFVMLLGQQLDEFK